jgi:RES domain-containing protein
MTGEVLFDEQQLSLPRDHGDRLYHAILANLTDETWCQWDWVSLNEDEALRLGWERFCEIVKHRRRFFFHSLGPTAEDRENYSAASLLRAIATLSEQLGIIGELPRDTRLWRAREFPKGKHVRASDFGPPPKQYALQTNRMNPPGIPMMYVASTARTAKLEAHAASAKVGQWRTLRPGRILDLRQPPNIPGIFSDATRHEILGMSFLWDFRADIMRPVARDERAHIDYLPSQVVTEYLRDFKFEGGPVDGIAYGSTVDSKGWNVALFVEPEDLGFSGDDSEERDPWLTFSHAIRV